MNLMMLLEMAAAGFGERTAVGTTDGAKLTYSELFSAASAAADHFDDENIDHVSLIDVSSPALPVAMFGSAWSGKPFVPLNYRLPETQLRDLCEDLTPTLVIGTESTTSAVQSLDGLATTPRVEFLNHCEGSDSQRGEWDMDPEAVAVLLYTSGTTGAPKAAVLRHKHLVSYILGAVEYMGAGEDEATLVAVPPYHVAGIAAICSSVYAGRRIVQLSEFDPSAWIDVATTEAITHAMVVPTMLSRIVDELENRRRQGQAHTVESLRALSYGGGKMPAPVIEKALELFPQTNFVNAYGLTETSSTVAVLGPEEHREAVASEDPAVRARLGSAGRLLPTVEVTIRDEDGKEVGIGESGEIWVRGDQVSGEYRDHAARLTADGWFPTHDGGVIDEHGYLFVSGRMDDVIIRGGENISPGEIEDVVISHPAVRDAAAIGIADVEWGEVIAVAIVAEPGEAPDTEEIKTLVKNELRGSRSPDHVVIVDELPYNETGKLLRRRLRDDLEHLERPGSSTGGTDPS
ncbi:MAG: class I adenylate-forming enzyme family protein [Acidimicrobiales bacterium]